MQASTRCLVHAQLSLVARMRTCGGTVSNGKDGTSAQQGQNINDANSGDSVTWSQNYGSAAPGSLSQYCWVGLVKAEFIG
jgi:hypothetical protein